MMDTASVPENSVAAHYAGVEQEPDANPLLILAAAAEYR
jgi:hypothetical protein